MKTCAWSWRRWLDSKSRCECHNEQGKEGRYEVRRSFQRADRISGPPGEFGRTAAGRRAPACLCVVSDARGRISPPMEPDGRVANNGALVWIRCAGAPARGIRAPAAMVYRVGATAA